MNLKIAETKRKYNKKANKLKSHYYQTTGTKNEFNSEKKSEPFLTYVKNNPFSFEQIH